MTSPPAGSKFGWTEAELLEMIVRAHREAGATDDELAPLLARLAELDAADRTRGDDRG